MAAVEMAERAARSKKSPEKGEDLKPAAEVKPSSSSLTLPIISSAVSLHLDGQRSGSSHAETLVNGVVNFD